MKNSILLFGLVFFLSFAVKATGEEPCAKVNVSELVSTNIDYPAEAIVNKEEGLVYVSFSISLEGATENINILESISTILDSKAIETVKNMKLEKMACKVNVDQVYTLPIKFILK